MTLGTNINARGLTFSAPGYTIAGASTLTIGTGGIDASGLSSGTTTISAPIKIDAGLQKWNVGAGSTLSLGTIVLSAEMPLIFTRPMERSCSSRALSRRPARDGWGWRSGAVAGTGVLGAGAVIDNGNGTYDMASVGSQTAGTSRTIVAPTYTTASNGDAHNVLVTSNTTVSPMLRGFLSR